MLEIRHTGKSSHKFGPCEYCGGWCDSVFLLRVKYSYTFGHKECLKKFLGKNISIRGGHEKNND